MKFIASTTTLLKALQTIGGAIANSPVLPILSDFLFELKNGTLTVFATDLEISMITELKVEAKDSGSIAIPAWLLMDTLKTLPEQPLVFKIDTKTLAIEITSETGRYKLVGEGAEDFPKMPVADSCTTINIPAPALGKAFSKTLFAVSSDDLRPAMTGVLFELSAESLTFVSTDAHCLVKLVRSDVKAKDAKFIVPKKAAHLLKSTMPDTDAVVNVAYNKSNAFFSFGNIKLITRLIDENYPDYNAVIPQNSPNKLTVNRLELINSLKRIALYSNKTTYQTVLSIAGSELNISSQDLDFNKEAIERITCSYEGEDIEIGFSARLLVDALTVLDSNDIGIDLSAPTRAGIIRPVENEENEVLVILAMPTTIN